MTTKRRKTNSSKAVNKNAWKQFLIRTKKKPENVSGKVDEIVYGIGR